MGTPCGNFWITLNARILVLSCGSAPYLAFLTCPFSPKFPKPDIHGKARDGLGLAPGVYTTGLEPDSKLPLYFPFFPWEQNGNKKAHSLCAEELEASWLRENSNQLEGE